MVFIVIKDNKTMPREKALNYGISSLNDNELLALIIKSGCKDKDIFDLANEIIEKANGFNNLYSLNYEELTNIKGIKKAKALEILAILEVSKRLSRIEKIDTNTIDGAKSLVDYCRCNIGFSHQEEFMAIFLNNNGEVLKYEILFKGSETSSIVSISEVIRRAILLKSSHIVIAHNHPSGKAYPSKEDITITEQLSSSLKMMNIKLLDHLIITKYDYYSFNKEGLL